LPKLSVSRFIPDLAVKLLDPHLAVASQLAALSEPGEAKLNAKGKGAATRVADGLAAAETPRALLVVVTARPTLRIIA
jgi:hypothetical protein